MEFEGDLSSIGDIETVKNLVEQRFKTVDVFLFNVRADQSMQNILAMTAAMRGVGPDDADLKAAFRSINIANSKLLEAIYHYIGSQQEVENLVKKLEQIQ